MKFYCLMIVSIVVDILIFLAISVLYKPVPGTRSFHIFQVVFLSPFVIISFLQLLKLVFNIKDGYVVTGFGPGFGMFKWHFDRNIFWFFVGVSSEIVIWIMLGVSVLRFLLKVK
jgi:hypothetical protein